MWRTTGIAAAIAPLVAVVALGASCTAKAPNRTPDAGPSSYQVAACTLLCQCVSMVGCTSACYQDTAKCSGSQLSSYLKCLQGKDACQAPACDGGTCPKQSACHVADYCNSGYPDAAGGYPDANTGYPDAAGGTPPDA